MSIENKKSEIDWYIISQVKQIRNKAKLGQEHIAIHLQVSTGYIGHVESQNCKAKYTTIQLNELAKLFKCSPREFWPEKPLN